MARLVKPKTKPKIVTMRVERYGSRRYQIFVGDYDEIVDSRWAVIDRVAAIERADPTCRVEVKWANDIVPP